MALAEPLLGPAGRRPRLDVLDNAKAALITCVVVYHMIVVYTSADRPESPIAYWSGLLVLLKAVVMPAFCLMSGHLSRADLDVKRARALFQLLAAFVLFQAVYHVQTMLAYRLNGFAFEPLPLQIFCPPMAVVTWFLFALLLWRAALPLLAAMRYPLATALALAHLGLFVDLGVNYANVLAFLPYFIGGYRLPRGAWATLGQPRVRAALGGTLLLVGGALLAFSAADGGHDAHFASAFERMALTYACFNGAPPEALAGECHTFHMVVQRAGFYAISLPLIGGFFCVLPRTAGWWTAPGYMSMYVYLLHPLVLFNPWAMALAFRALSALYGRETNVWSPATDVSAVALLVPFALACVGLLSTPLVRRLAWPLVEPPTDLLFAPEPKAATAPADAREARG